MEWQKCLSLYPALCHRPQPAAKAHGCVSGTQDWGDSGIRLHDGLIWENCAVTGFTLLSVTLQGPQLPAGMTLLSLQQACSPLPVRGSTKNSIYTNVLNSLKLTLQSAFSDGGRGVNMCKCPPPPQLFYVLVRTWAAWWCHSEILARLCRVASCMHLHQDPLRHPGVFSRMGTVGQIEGYFSAVVDASCSETWLCPVRFPLL